MPANIDVEPVLLDDEEPNGLLDERAEGIQRTKSRSANARKEHPEVGHRRSFDLLLQHCCQRKI